MKRSYNYSGRQRFDSSDFTLSQFESGGSLSFSLSLHPQKTYEIPESAAVSAEAYVGSSIESFSLGPWKNPMNGVKQPITTFDASETIRFRIKVIDESNRLRPLLAWRERISPIEYDGEGGKRVGILPVRPQDLGNSIWKLDWVDETTPRLLVNSRVSEAKDIKSIVRSDSDFAALVFPEVFSRILNKLGRENDLEEEDSDWRKFAMQFAATEPPIVDTDDPGSVNDFEKWVARTIDQFSEVLDFLPRYKKSKSIDS